VGADSAEHWRGEVPEAVRVVLIEGVRGDTAGKLGEGGGAVVDDGGLLVVAELTAADAIEQW